MNKIAEFNLPYLYDIFSELDELGHMDVADDLCQAVLGDPMINSVLPSVYAGYTHFLVCMRPSLQEKFWPAKNPGRYWNLFLYMPDMKI
ncbi:MAG: hypothetical protein AB9861_14865 [Methanosarcina sp.]